MYILNVYMYLRVCGCENLFDWLGLYGISTIVGYLMLKPVYAYVWNLYDLVFMGFMAYQPLKVT